MTVYLSVFWTTQKGASSNSLTLSLLLSLSLFISRSFSVRYSGGKGGVRVIRDASNIFLLLFMSFSHPSAPTLIFSHNCYSAVSYHPARFPLFLYPLPPPCYSSFLLPPISSSTHTLRLLVVLPLLQEKFICILMNRMNSEPSNNTRGRETDRDRQTERDRQTDIDRETDRETDRKTDRKTDRDRQIERTERERKKEAPISQ